MCKSSAPSCIAGRLESGSLVKTQYINQLLNITARHISTLWWTAGGARWQITLSCTLMVDNIFVSMGAMDYDIRYYSEAVQELIFELPDTLAARYVVLTRRMQAIGPNLGQPHT